MRQRRKRYLSKKTKQKPRPRKLRSRTCSLQRLLTAQELEAMLRIDRKTLYKYAAERSIPHIRLGGNVRFREADIAEWIERHTILP